MLVYFKGFYFEQSAKAYKQAGKDGHSTGYVMDCYGSLIPVHFDVWSNLLAWSNIHILESYTDYFAG